MKRRFLSFCSMLCIFFAGMPPITAYAAQVGIPLTGENRGSIMIIMVGLLIVSAVLIVAYLALSGKNNKKKK